MRFFHAIRIEEYAALGISITISSFLLWRHAEYVSVRLVTQSLSSYLFYGVKVFWVFSIFFFAYFLFKLYVTLGTFFTALREGKRAVMYFPGPLFQFLKAMFRFSLTAVLFLVTFSVAIALFLGVSAEARSSYLVTDNLLKLDQYLTGGYPFVTLHTVFPISLRELISPFIIFSFEYLTTVVSITAILLLLVPVSRRFFSGFVISILISLFLGLPFWYFFPALSPNNAYLADSTHVSSRSVIQEILREYEPDSHTRAFLQRVTEAQRAMPPVSTIPSMHFAWALITLIYLFRFQKILGFLALPWFFFSNLGTVYLAQHFAVDLVAALPIALFSIGIAEILSRLEPRYFLQGTTEDFRNILRRDIMWFFRTIQSFVLRMVR